MTLLGPDFDTRGPSPRTFARWQALEPALADHDDLASLVAEVRNPDTPLERENARLAALIRLARRDDEALVALIIVLRPRIRAMARRFGASLDRPDAEAEYLTAFVARARRYDLDRLPPKLATNLLLGAARKLRATRDRHKTWRNTTVHLNGTDPTTALPGPGAGAGLEGVELSPHTTIALAVRAGAIKAADATLVTATKLDGLPLADAAHLLGITYEAAKKRRQRACAALAAYLHDPEADR